MFERRLKIFLLILSGIVAALLIRAMQLQMVQRSYWSSQAADTLKSVKFLQTTRGTITDYRGNVLALDQPCVDACVMYRALTKEDKWLREHATNRLKARMGDAWSRKMPSDQRKALVEAEVVRVSRDIDGMWDKLAELSGQPREQIETLRQSIIHRVEMRKRYSWYRGYAKAVAKDGKLEAEEESRWQRWLSGESDDGPEIDKFAVTVTDEKLPHVILHAVGLELCNELQRHIERYPGLVFQPGTHRYYPYDDVACHVLGRIATVNDEELKSNPFKNDQRRKYWPSDEIGRSGVEKLCEPALRGTLGAVTNYGSGNSVTEQPIPGQDVRLSIDIELQREIQQFFADGTIHLSPTVIENHAIMHGAAVLIDVKTNEVRALVSYPTFSLNRYDEEFQKYNTDYINEPLRDRATESPHEPGSTVKPLVGLSAITEGAIGVNEGIECTGFLRLPDSRGRMIKYPFGRCWVASMFLKDLGEEGVKHHQVPDKAKHHGHDGNLDGYLTYSDALERSCNVYFETVASRLGIDRLNTWMIRFGLGRKTGIGIDESGGLVPGDVPVASARERDWTCFAAGMGQGRIAVTPIQMANVAATIARGGMWMRPRLIAPNPETGQMPTTRALNVDGPDRVDLHLSPDAIKACRLGMFNVVNSLGGTGRAAHMQQLDVAGKTGTAQASKFTVFERDAAGKPVPDRSGKHKFLFTKYEPSTPDHPNPEMPWYRAPPDHPNQLDHAWMIGYAPADDPKIAFAVMVEYGGSGGGAAADVVRVALESCIRHGYLQAKPPQPAPQQTARRDGELLFELQDQ